MASNSPTPPPSGNERYFCHSCAREVRNINRESFTCPFCNQGFLELLPERGNDQNERSVSVDEEDEHDIPPQAQADFNEFFRNVALPLLFPGMNRQNPQHAGGQPSPSMPSNPARPSPSGGQQDQGRQQAPQPLQGFFQNLLQSLAGNAGGGAFHVQVQFNGEDGQPHMFGFPQMPLHGNPGDYAWGPGGLDEIVTRLLNQFEGGPPPLTEDEIRNITQTDITQDQVEKRLQCTVCMDDFKVAEKVRRLDCGHHFHDACIVPWLSRHNTCPVCRKAAVKTEDRAAGGSSNAPSGGSSGSAGGNAGAGTSRPTTQARPNTWDVIEELD